MAAASIPGIHGWDNAYYAWPCCALGLSALPGGRCGLGVPVRCGRPVAGNALPLRPRRGPVPLCPPLIPHDCPRPVWHGGRSRLLTRGTLTALCCSPRQGCRPLGACCEAYCPRRAVASASSMPATPALRRMPTAVRRWAWDGPALTASMRMREADGWQGAARKEGGHEANQGSFCMPAHR
jgi:hypothetical protein